MAMKEPLLPQGLIRQEEPSAEPMFGSYRIEPREYEQQLDKMYSTAKTVLEGIYDVDNKQFKQTFVEATRTRIHNDLKKQTGNSDLEVDSKEVTAAVKKELEEFTNDFLANFDLKSSSVGAKTSKVDFQPFLGDIAKATVDTKHCTTPLSSYHYNEESKRQQKLAEDRLAKLRQEKEAKLTKLTARLKKTGNESKATDLGQTAERLEQEIKKQYQALETKTKQAFEDSRKAAVERMHALHTQHSRAVTGYVIIDPKRWALTRKVSKWRGTQPEEERRIEEQRRLLNSTPKNASQIWDNDSNDSKVYQDFLLVREQKEQAQTELFTLQLADEDGLDAENDNNDLKKNDFDPFADSDQGFTIRVPDIKKGHKPHDLQLSAKVESSDNKQNRRYTLGIKNWPKLSGRSPKDEFNQMVQCFSFALGAFANDARNRGKTLVVNLSSFRPKDRSATEQEKIALAIAALSHGATFKGSKKGEPINLSDLPEYVPDEMVEQILPDSLKDFYKDENGKVRTSDFIDIFNKNLMNVMQSKLNSEEALHDSLVQSKVGIMDTHPHAEPGSFADIHSESDQIELFKGFSPITCAALLTSQKLSDTTKNKLIAATEPRQLAYIIEAVRSLMESSKPKSIDEAKQYSSDLLKYTFMQLQMYQQCVKVHPDKAMDIAKHLGPQTKKAFIYFVKDLDSPEITKMRAVILDSLAGFKAVLALLKGIKVTYTDQQQNEHEHILFDPKQLSDQVLFELAKHARFTSQLTKHLPPDLLARIYRVLISRNHFQTRQERQNWILQHITTAVRDSKLTKVQRQKRLVLFLQSAKEPVLLAAVLDSLSKAWSHIFDQGNMKEMQACFRGFLKAKAIDGTTPSDYKLKETMPLLISLATINVKNEEKGRQLCDKFVTIFTDQKVRTSYLNTFESLCEILKNLKANEYDQKTSEYTVGYAVAFKKLAELYTPTNLANTQQKAQNQLVLSVFKSLSTKQQLNILVQYVRTKKQLKTKSALFAHLSPKAKAQLIAYVNRDLTNASQQDIKANERQRSVIFQLVSNMKISDQTVVMTEVETCRGLEVKKGVSDVKVLTTMEQEEFKSVTTAYDKGEVKYSTAQAETGLRQNLQQFIRDVRALPDADFTDALGAVHPDDNVWTRLNHKMSQGGADYKSIHDAHDHKQYKTTNDSQAPQAAEIVDIKAVVKKAYYDKATRLLKRARRKAVKSDDKKAVDDEMNKLEDSWSAVEAIFSDGTIAQGDATQKEKLVAELGKLQTILGAGITLTARSKASFIEQQWDHLENRDNPYQKTSYKRTEVGSLGCVMQLLEDVDKKLVDADFNFRTITAAKESPWHIVNQKIDANAQNNFDVKTAYTHPSYQYDNPDAKTKTIDFRRVMEQELSRALYQCQMATLSAKTAVQQARANANLEVAKEAYAKFTAANGYFADNPTAVGTTNAHGGSAFRAEIKAELKKIAGCVRVATCILASNLDPKSPTIDSDTKVASFVGTGLIQHFDLFDSVLDEVKSTVPAQQNPTWEQVNQGFKTIKANNDKPKVVSCYNVHDVRQFHDAKSPVVDMRLIIRDFYKRALQAARQAVVLANADAKSPQEINDTLEALAEIRAQGVELETQLQLQKSDGQAVAAVNIDTIKAAMTAINTKLKNPIKAILAKRKKGQVESHVVSHLEKKCQQQVIVKLKQHNISGAAKTLYDACKIPDFQFVSCCDLQTQKGLFFEDAKVGRALIMTPKQVAEIFETWNNKKVVGSTDVEPEALELMEINAAMMKTNTFLRVIGNLRSPKLVQHLFNKYSQRLDFTADEQLQLLLTMTRSALLDNSVNCDNPAQMIANVKSIFKGLPTAQQEAIWNKLKYRSDDNEFAENVNYYLRTVLFPLLTEQMQNDYFQEDITGRTKKINAVGVFKLKTNLSRVPDNDGNLYNLFNLDKLRDQKKGSMADLDISPFDVKYNEQYGFDGTAQMHSVTDELFSDGNCNYFSDVAQNDAKRQENIFKKRFDSKKTVDGKRDNEFYRKKLWHNNDPKDHAKDAVNISKFKLAELSKEPQQNAVIGDMEHKVLAKVGAMRDLPEARKIALLKRIPSALPYYPRKRDDKDCPKLLSGTKLVIDAKIDPALSPKGARLFAVSKLPVEEQCSFGAGVLDHYIARFYLLESLRELKSKQLAKFLTSSYHSYDKKSDQKSVGTAQDCTNHLMVEVARRYKGQGHKMLELLQDLNAEPEVQAAVLSATNPYEVGVDAKQGAFIVDYNTVYTTLKRSKKPKLLLDKIERTRNVGPDLVAKIKQQAASESNEEFHNRLNGIVTTPGQAELEHKENRSSRTLRSNGGS